MSASRSFLTSSNAELSPSELGVFSLAGAFDYFDPHDGIMPECEFNLAVNNKLVKLGHIAHDARKILAKRTSHEIKDHARRIQAHISQNSTYFLNYMRFNQLLDESSPAKALLFCIDDFMEQAESESKGNWTKADSFSVLALSLIANMYANFWKSISEFGINSNSDWNFRHYEWFIQFDHLAKEAIDHASNELMTDAGNTTDGQEPESKVVRPDHIIAHYIDFMLAQYEKCQAEKKRFVFKAYTNAYIASELNEEEIYMMGSDKCLNSLLKQWRDYRRVNPEWQNS